MSVTHTVQRTTQPGPRHTLPVVLAAVIGMFLLAACAFWLAGGRWFAVRTPSMGGAAPVGSLVLTVPVHADQLHIGDVVAFHPPTEPDVTYTHRVIAIGPDGATTRGDINGAQDPWPLTDNGIVGKVATVTPGLGWLFRALPLLLMGALLVWALTRWWVAPANRGPLRMAGATLVFAVAALVLKPFVGVTQLANTSDPDGASRISVVSTGLLPVRLTPAPGHGTARPVDLAHAGRAGVSVLTGGTDGRKYVLDTHLHLGPLQLLLLVAFCLLPLLWTLVVGFRPEPGARHAGPSRHRAVTA
jgi:signal peptidase I